MLPGGAEVFVSTAGHGKTRKHRGAGRLVAKAELNSRPPLSLCLSRTEISLTTYRLVRQSKRYKSSDIDVPQNRCSLCIRKQDSRTSRLKEASGGTGPNISRRGGPGIGFNLLWLEFQNTRWLMHIAFGSVPSFLCSRISQQRYSLSLSPSLHYTVHI